MSRTPTYRAWEKMRRRCHDPKYERYGDWGGRGIKVCDEWRASFAAFLAYMGEKPPGLMLDRIDNDGNYEPGNCRWATRSEQMRNQRRTVWVEHRGRRVKLADLCDELGLKRWVVYARLKIGWSLDRAIS